MWRCAILLAVTLGLALAGSHSARAEVAAHQSTSALPFSNGFGAGIYDASSHRVTGFRDHLYARWDASTPSHDLLYDFYFGLRAGGINTWLSDRPVAEAGYDPRSGIVRVVQEHAGLRATQYFFAPFSVNAPVLVAVVEVENTSAAPMADAALFAIQNLHVGSGAEATAGEHITWQDGAYEERGALGLVVQVPVPAPAVFAASPDNPWQAVNAGGHMTSRTDSGVTDDAVAGFEWDLSGLAPGESKTFAVILAHDAGGQRSAVNAALSPVAEKSASELLAGARADWSQFFSRAQAPEGLSAGEAAVYDQQLAVLRMAQVREPAPARGQIVASVPPGKWNIAWVRDQSYATFALIDAGLFAEARDALAFLLDGDAGHYVCCDAGGGPYVGRDYAISVVRYFGNGVEESDSNQNGPNVEFDGFGLTLMALDAYLSRTGDSAFIDDHAGAIFGGTADVLVSLIEPDTGLVRADSSIWETHWDGGGRRHHTFTQATSVAGLWAAARLAEKTGRTDDAARYSAAAATVAEAIAAHLVDPRNQVLRGSVEETDLYLDAAAIEAFNWGVLAGDGDIAKATLDAFRTSLWNPVTGHGYRRNDDGGEYDLREWIVIDLRVATAARRAHRDADAAALLSWVTAQASQNFGLLPENFDRETGDFLGEVPMAGFGAGAYVSALWDRAGRALPPPPSAADAGMPPAADAGMDPAATGGGGCGVVGAAPASGPALTWIALIAALMAWRFTKRARCEKTAGR